MELVNNQCSIFSRTPGNSVFAPELQARRINKIEDLHHSVNRRVGRCRRLSGGVVGSELAIGLAKRNFLKGRQSCLLANGIVPFADAIRFYLGRALLRPSIQLTNSGKRETTDARNEAARSMRGSLSCLSTTYPLPWKR